MSTENKYEPKNLKDPKAWAEACAANTDGYGGAGIRAAAHTMCLLDDGKSPKEAEETGFKGKDLTGFLAGCAAGIIAQVHERGDEFNEYWNTRFGAPAGSKGTVNPALMTMRD